MTHTWDPGASPWRIGTPGHILAIAAAFVASAAAQQATCYAESQVPADLVGADGSNMCELAARLGEQCGGQRWNVPELALIGTTYPIPGTWSPYNGPSPQVDACACSIVAYNLFSACAACQTKPGIIAWPHYSVWKSGCTERGIDSSSFQYTDLGQQRWMSVLTSDDFDLEFAINASNNSIPDTTTGRSMGMPNTLSHPTMPHSASAAASFIDDNTITITTFVSPTPDSATSSNNSSSTSKNLLPIILAPILALVGLAGLFFLWWYCVKRRKAKRTAPSAEFAKYQRTSDMEGSGSGSGMMMMEQHRALGGGGEGTATPTFRDHPDGDAPPLFTPGLFKDPIFEKGVAMSLANQSGTWPGRQGSGHSDIAATAVGAGVGGAGGGAGTRQNSLGTLAGGGGDSPASASVLGGHSLQERQRLIGFEDRY